MITVMPIFPIKECTTISKLQILIKMHEDGVNFTNAYVTAPICSPSRVGIITGQYQARSGNYFYGGPGLDKNVNTMPQGF